MSLEKVREYIKSNEKTLAEIGQVSDLFYFHMDRGNIEALNKSVSELRTAWQENLNHKVKEGGEGKEELRAAIKVLDTILRLVNN